MKRYYRDIDGKREFFKGILYANGMQVFNPTEQMLVDAGWTEYVPPESGTYVPSYEELVVQKIRERYSTDDELAILRQRDTKTEEFSEYFDYCERCKKEAKEGLNI